MLFIFLLLHLFLPTSPLQKIFPVIIIGGGAAGIGASVHLTQNHIEHVIIEARSRLGGRIYSKSIAGVQIDLGASFVHNPIDPNEIHKFAQKLEWKHVNASLNNLSTLFPRKKKLSETEKSDAWQIYDDFTEYNDKIIAEKDNIDLSSVWRKFLPSIKDQDYNPITIHRAFFQLELVANVNGANLDKLSAHSFTDLSKQENDDYIPDGSFAKLLLKIFEVYCKEADVVYNQFVKKIDYSESMVKVTTEAGHVYTAKKVISSIPLGVLKAKKVQFVPNLPDSYQKAITRMGNGVFNKIIVTFNQSIFKKQKRVYDFVSEPGQPLIYPQCFIYQSSPVVSTFFVNGNASKALNLMSDADIIANLTTTIKRYFPGNYSVSNYIITRWQQDPYSLGSYSYQKVGSQDSTFEVLMNPIEDKLWLIGEHVHPTNSSYAHSAFQTGLSAAKQVVKSLQKQ